MNLTEQKKQLDVLAKVTERFNSQYRRKQFGKYETFVSDSDRIFSICAFPGENALVIEYADDQNDAAAGRFEDGDRFFLDEYKSLDSLIDAMQAEIES